MLLSFCCENFKSFQNGFEFQMTPESRMTELKYSILEETIQKKKVRALSVSTIYGPNAAGKTSIVNAMSCFRQIVLRGSISDMEDNRVGDYVSNKMTLIPFRFSAIAQPVVFDVTFTHQGVKYRYMLSFVVGNFLSQDENRYINCEKLWLNDVLVFDRGRDHVDVLTPKAIKAYLNVGYDMADAEKHRLAMENNLSDTTLLLTTDFNSFCSKAIVSMMKEWFAKRFIVINSSDHKQFYPNLPEWGNKVVIERNLNQIAKKAGIVGSDFAYISNPETHQPMLVSILNQAGNKFDGIDAEWIESVGTTRLITIMPAIISALQNGSVLVMDELDASLHPMIVMNLISLFHNDEVNKYRAQLIFNTHNPIYLNNRLLRRDEIKFVERDEDTKVSVLYSLSDFKTNGESSVRKTSDYMKNYFVNRYGAIVNVDFTDIILNMMNKMGETADEPKEQ